MSFDDCLPLKNQNYQIVKFLKQRELNYLFLGKHTVSQKTVLIKILRPALLQNKELSFRFSREIQMHLLLSHPHIVKILDWGKWNHFPYFVTEYIPGSTLRHLIENRSCNFSEIKKILLDIASALSYLHSLDIVHRDLKPENILLSETNITKILDFGIASSPSFPLPSCLLNSGTPHYMKAQLNSVSSDIYALGVLAYELLTQKICFGKIKIATLPSCLQTIINRMLQKNSKSSYKNIDDFSYDLHQISL